MKKISSSGTFFNKRVFPFIWFGFLIVFLLMSASAMLKKGELNIEAILVPLVMMVFGYFIMKHLVFDLIDEVWDAGDYLLLKNKGIEERITLSNIINLSYTVATSPHRVTLSLRTPSKFGKEVTFSPPMSWVPLKKSPLITGLIDRIDETRRS